MNPIIQFSSNRYDFYILIIISIITILLVLTFNLGKDSDTLEYETICVNNTIEYSIPKICNSIYSNMYSYCQFGEIYSEILLWGLFSTYCIQTKELQMIFPIIISLMTLVCIIWNIILNTNIINNNCYDIIYSYDYLSMIMFIINSILLMLIFSMFIIFIVYYFYKQKKYQNNKKIENIEDNIELINKV